MKSETFEEFQKVADELLKVNRLSGSEGSVLTKKRIKRFLGERGIKYSEEFFHVEKLFPVKASIEVNNLTIPCVPYIGSPSGRYEGYAKRDIIKGDIALVKVSEEAIKIPQAKDNGAKAVITYMETLNTHYYGIVSEGDFPVVNVKKEAIERIEDAYVRITVETKKEKVLCSNILFEIGRGPIVYLVAHTDTKPGVFGAIDNGIGFLLLLFIADELRKNYNLPYRVRFLLTDAEELGLEGSKFHIGMGVKYAYHCINVDAVGWYHPAVIYKDAEGYNGDKLMDMFARHIQDMKVSVDFRCSHRAKSDHIPFKKAGLQTLFLSSNPFTIRHTLYDNLDAVNWDIVRMWYELILSFLRRFHKL
ncbi:MAG: M28 family peptidase [Hydrogenobacter sp.]|uniref:M28 family peptidase n=1 Tax=Hydrogenobacter thermophilus TaxID=940 RepID=UPI0030FB819B